ncbi:hypothetical protein BHE74_00033790 [Ensete ventricosum]|nr:hypothetical protein BHE74_00033790 [Ensete ventricosum]
MSRSFSFTTSNRAYRRGEHPCEIDPLAKKVKMPGDSEAPCKEAPVALASNKMPTLEVPRGEGSSRQKYNVNLRARSMRDLCRVRAHSLNEPFLAQEIARLPKRVIDELSMLIEDLQVDVWKLKEEVGLVVVATTEA